MAAVVGSHGGDKRRPPTRHEAVGRVEGAEARESRTDEPEFLLPSPLWGEGLGVRGCPRHLVDADVAGDMRRSRQETGVVRTGRLDARGDVRCIPEDPPW